MGYESQLHIPVLVQEVVKYLPCESGRVFVDCTIGTGGHARAILEASQPHGQLFGLDRDPGALEVAREHLRDFCSRVVLFHEDFRHVETLLLGKGIKQVDGILFDLGVSSLQLSDPERGFSFQHDGPLDMRMDRQRGVTAADLVNRLPEKALSDTFYHYGEERWARRIAASIVRARAEDRIQTTRQLSNIVTRAVPSSSRSRRLHPATRTFQALRIMVNHELEGLSDTLQAAVRLLCLGGRLCVIAFHSLEDRIVKHTFRALENDLYTPIQRITRKPIRPSPQEITRNPRSRSARLRIVERRTG